LRSIGNSRRAGSSMNTSAQSMVSTSRSSSSALYPAAYKPPTIAPMLVPDTAQTGMRSRSSTLSTPMCAEPRAPPPPSTRPTQPGSSTVVEVDADLDVLADAGVDADIAPSKANPSPHTHRHTHDLTWCRS